MPDGALGAGSKHFALIADVSDPDVVYIGGYSDRLRGAASQVAGSQWERMIGANTLSNTSPHWDLRDYAFRADGMLLESDDGGVFGRSLPIDWKQGDWIGLSGDLQSLEGYNIAYDPLADIIITGAQDNGTEQQKTIGGFLWYRTIGGDGVDVAVDVDEVYDIPDDVPDQGPVQVSTRYGGAQNFITFLRFRYSAANEFLSAARPAMEVVSGNPEPTWGWITPMEVNRVSGERVIVAHYGTPPGVYESMDRCETLVEIAGGLTVRSDALAYGAAGNPDVLYVGANEGVWVRTAAHSAPLEKKLHLAVNDVEVDPDDPAHAFVNTSTTIIRTEDSGEIWSDVTGNLDSLDPGALFVLVYFPDPPNDFLLVGTAKGVFWAREADGFSNWSPTGTGLPVGIVFDMDRAIPQRKIVVSSFGYGVWSAILPAVTNWAPTVTDETFRILPSAANNDPVGTVQATDPEDGTLTYAITAGNTGNALAIDPGSGAITVNDSTQLVNSPFTLTVEVTDGGVPAETGTGTITVLTTLCPDPTIVLNLQDSGDCSLRDRVAVAPTGSTVTFDASLAGGEILLQGEILISGKTLTVDGTDRGITVKRDPAVAYARLFRYTGLADVTLRNLTLAGGNCVGQNCGGSGSERWLGGAVYVQDNSVTAGFDRVTFRDNNASYGGTLNVRGIVSIESCTFEGTTSGTAVTNYGRLVVRGSTFANNNLALHSTADTDVVNSTFSGNLGTAMQFLNVAGQTVNVVNVTLSGNANGITVRDLDGAAPFGTVTVTNTILAGNTTNCTFVNGGTIVDDGGNLADDGSCAPLADNTGLDLMLGPLQDNGGPTATHALYPGSPAVNAPSANLTACADPATVNGVDQRGGTRDATCDLGAFEVTVPLNAPPAAYDDAFTVSPVAPPGTPVGTVQAVDPESGTLAYAIIAGNTGGAFTVDPGTGEITVASTGALANQPFTLTVEVTDEGIPPLSDTATVSIQVTECPDPTVVKNLLDSGDCSLRDRVSEAPDGSTIIFDASLAGGEILLQSEILITGKTLTVDGADRAVTIKRDPAVSYTRLFRYASNANVTLRQLTLADGNCVGQNCGGSGGQRWRGGGVYAQDSSVVAVFDGVTFRNNNASYGSALNTSGTTTVVDCAFEGTTSDYAISNYGPLWVEGSTFAGNSNGLAANGALTLVNSTFHGQPGNAVFVWNPVSPTAELVNVTVSGNGAGIVIQDADGVEPFAAATLTNTLLGGNTANCNGSNGGTFVDGGGNLADDASCAPLADNTGLDLMLGPLQDNGGPTHTRALLAGSPAIDAASANLAACADPATVNSLDQRVRPRDAACDLGAFEAVSPGVDLAVTQSESADPVEAGAGSLTYVVTVTNRGPGNATGVRIEEDLTFPAGVSVFSIIPSAGTFDWTPTLDGTWVLGDLANGASENLEIVLLVDASAAAGTDVIHSTAWVSAVNEDDTDSGNDAVTLSTSISTFVALVPTVLVDGLSHVVAGESVDVPVRLETAGEALGSVSFSLDYDESCLGYVGYTVSADLALGFSVIVLTDALDTDGEIDVSIADVDAPVGTLTDGELLTFHFDVVCPVVPTMPADPAMAVDAAVAFSLAPAVSFGSTASVDVEGDQLGGGVRIWPGPRGDCNSGDSVGAADLTAVAEEIFDGDGNLWFNAPSPTFAGSPAGCDANATGVIAAGDVTCVNRRVFGHDCAAGSDRTAPWGTPELQVSTTREGEIVWIRANLRSNGHAVGGLAFSLDIDPALLPLGELDATSDGVPDHLRFPLGQPGLARVSFDAGDTDGELDVLLADLRMAPLRDGFLVEVGVPGAATTAGGLRLSGEPEASFGTVNGTEIDGVASVDEHVLFADGFESGDASAWVHPF